MEGIAGVHNPLPEGEGERRGSLPLGEGDDGEAALGSVLEALPYVARYLDKTLVIKLGGSVGDEGTLLEDLVQLNGLGIRPVLVHGGGAQISDWMGRVG